MDDMYAPIRRAEQVIHAVQQVTQEMPLTPREKMLVQTVFMDTARQTAMNIVGNSLMKPYENSLRCICPFREHTINLSVQGRTCFNER